MQHLHLFEAFNSSEIAKKGKELTNKIKTQEANVAEYKHMPCYDYVYQFMKQFLPSLNPNIIQDFKMAYKKDINLLKNTEVIQLSKSSLQNPSQPVTMQGLSYVNNKYNIGTIVNVDQAKIGDAISFWVYELIEFSTKEKNYSFPETEANFKTYLIKNKLDTSKLPEWLIEGAILKYGHYGIISDMDDKYIYLTSSGEKKGVNGIWNNVSREDCSENYTRLLKDDLRKFQKMSLNDLLFKSTDHISNRRTMLVLRNYILNFIK